MSSFAETAIPGAWTFTGVRHADNRGWFQELFKKSVVMEQTGMDFAPVQLNLSYSSRGVIRGIHYSLASQGQAKYVTVMAGEIDDYIIDVRDGSPTFGQWQRVRISSSAGNGVLLASNLAHAFQAVSDEAIVCYAVTAEFNPEAEKAINPFCDLLAIDWLVDSDISTSEKDRRAPNTEQQRQMHELPMW